MTRSAAVAQPGRTKLPKSIPLAVRREVYERADGVCERCQWSHAVHLHHRQKRSQGGRHTVENLVAICVPCHTWAHSAGAAAYDTGWLVRRGDDPASICPVPLGVDA